MRRDPYDGPFTSRPRYERMVLRPDWGRPHPSDPNWRDGAYHGMRSHGGPWQAEYGRFRRDHEGDLGGSGGYQGRYERPMGEFGPGGLLREADRPRPRREGAGRQRYDADLRAEEGRWQGGGVRGGLGYLRQYNSHSPAVRYADDYHASRGEPRSRGRQPPPAPKAPRDREYGGYNSGGWAPGTWTGPGSRRGR